MKKSARVSEKLVSPGLPGLQVATRLERKKYFPAFKPCYTVQFSQQFVSQCSCDTSCLRITQCNMGCLAIILLRKTLHEVLNSALLFATDCSNWQHHCTVYSFLAIFPAVSTKARASAHFLFFVPRSVARQVGEKIAQCNRARLSEQY